MTNSGELIFICIVRGQKTTVWGKIQLETVKNTTRSEEAGEE